MKKKIRLRILVFATLFFVLVFVLYRFLAPYPEYEFKNNKFSYHVPSNPEYSIISKSENNSIDIYRISYYSRDFQSIRSRLYALVFVPRSSAKVPAILFLPGGGGTKESRSYIGESFASHSYAVLIPDQRGVGETSSPALSFQDDLRIFSSGSEPTQFLSVYDALISFKILSSFPNVDKQNVFFSGESMGARYAIIASSMEKDSRGLLAISTSGFHFSLDPAFSQLPKQQADFLLSIDPDSYITDISSPIFFFHCQNDSVVKLQDSKYTFSLAHEPKRFFLYSNCSHGYSPLMLKDLLSSLETSRKSPVF